MEIGISIFLFLSLIDRIQSFRASELFPDHDIALTNDTPKRRYMTTQLLVAMKQHGDSLKHVEAMTIKYGEEMLQKMEAYGQEAFDPAELLITTFSSIMLTLIYGHVEDEQVKKHAECSRQMIKVFGSNGPFMMLDVLPISRFILPPVKKAYDEFRVWVNNYVTLYEKITAARRKLYKHPQVEYFIDHFLKLSITNKFDEDPTRVVDDLDIQAMGASMFSAGILITSSTMQMMLAILVNRQDIQNQAYAEIEESIGKRIPTLEDRSSMPFTEALILETLRYHSAAMVAIPHLARCDTELNGYFIPKGKEEGDPKFDLDLG